jgi:hypothetical protein
VQAAGASEVVKVKSIATDEIGLGHALEASGIASQETDLAELIIQLAHDSPSHILVPAIHFNRAEIRALFRRELPGTEALTDDRRRCARPPGGSCATSSCPPRSRSAAPTSPSPRPGPWSCSSPRATAACARRCRGR